MRGLFVSALVLVAGCSLLADDALSTKPGATGGMGAGANGGSSATSGSATGGDATSSGGGVTSTGGQGGIAGSGGSGGAGGAGGEPGPGGMGGAGGRERECPPEDTMGSGPCPSECSSCSAGVCNIDCVGNGGQTCNTANVICPAGWACAVHCVDKGCSDITIFCPEGYPCQVDCQDNEACMDAIVDCADIAGSCSLSCEAADPTSCSGTQLDCGAGACNATCLSAGVPHVSCETSCDCEECS